MTECCISKEPGRQPSRRHRCPVNGKEYASVGRKTILHHLENPWELKLREQNYYFCSDSDCDVVYFGLDNSVIPKSGLRTIVGVKEKNPERVVCYCFGVSHATARQNGKVKQFIKDRTRQSLCSCETSNPSGRCCLGSFPKR